MAHIGCPHASALRKTQVALSVRKWSHTATFGFCSAAHCDRALGESVFDLEHDGAAITQRKDCTILHAWKQVLACHSHIRFWTVSAFDFSLDWDRIHSSEEEKQQNPKSWVQFFGTLFLAVRGTLLFASCQNGATKHHPAGFSILGLVVWRRAWLATWSKRHKSSSNMSGFWYGFWLASVLDIVRGSPAGMLLAGDTQGASSEQCSNAWFVLQCCFDYSLKCTWQFS